MIFFKKIFAIFILLFFYFGCKNNVAIDESETDLLEENKTYLEIKNQSQFDVNIYFNLPSADSLWLKVPTGDTVKKEIKPSQSEAGDVVYIEYEYVVGNVVLPYYEPESCIEIFRIYKNKINTLNLSNISSFGLDKAYVIIQNESSDAVFLTKEEKEPISPNSSDGDKWINTNQNVTYVFERESKDSEEIDFENYYIGNGLYNIKIDVLDRLKVGNVYTLIYNEEKIALFCNEPLALSIKNKIWKNSLSKTYGKDLVVGCISPRENKEDGYMIFGSLSASSINDSIEGNKPYYAFINTDGEIFKKKEYILTFRDKDQPKRTDFYYCIEKNGIALTVGKNEYEDKSESLFIYGFINENSFYKNIPDIKKYKPCGISHVDDKKFCILLGYEDDENKNKIFGYELLEVTVDDSNNIVTKFVYESGLTEKENKRVPCSVVYYDDKYAILSQDCLLENSFIDIIDCSLQKNVNIIEIPSFSLNKMKLKESEIYLSGSKISGEGLDVATFGKINLSDTISSKTVKLENFKTFSASNEALNSNFNDFIFDDNNIILGGFSCAAYDYNHRDQVSEITREAVPFVVSYNICKNKLNWEKEYTDQKGYVVYTLEKSAIDSLFLDLWNYGTRHSYITSTGLLGEIPEKIKQTLPSSPYIENREGVDVKINFYENSTSQTPYESDMFKCGKEYTLEDLSKYKSSKISESCKVVGWYVLSKDDDNIINNNLSIARSTFGKPYFLQFHPMGTPNDKVENSTTEDVPMITDNELVFPVTFFNTTDIHLYPKIEHGPLENLSYDKTYHWESCDCGEKKQNKREHSFGDWKTTVLPTKLSFGKKIKTCSICQFEESVDIEYLPVASILNESPDYEINDEGNYGLEESSKSLLNLANYNQYMNDHYIFSFEVEISYEAYWWLWTSDWDHYEEGNKEIFLYKSDPGYVSDSYNTVDKNKARSKYGLLKDKSWDEDKGIQNFTWEVNGSDCTNKMCIRYDASGESEDTWYVRSIKVNLSINPKN